MFLNVIKHADYRKELIKRLYRLLLKENNTFPDPVFKDFYSNLFKSEFHKFS